MTALLRVGEMLSSLASSDGLLRHGGVVTAISPSRVKLLGLAQRVKLGGLVRIGDDVVSEVVDIEGEHVIVCPFADTETLTIGQTGFVEEKRSVVPDESWLGRIFDAVGNPVDELPRPSTDTVQNAGQDAVAECHAMKRARVNQPIRTGIRVIDIFTPLCFGQRIGIFAGSGVGKSTLLSMLARSEAFDAVVVAMVGERNREVREFLEESIGPEHMAKTIAVVATSDESPILRRRAPEFALDICQSLRRKGKRVLLLMDSVTRYAHALREIGISRNEPPIARGYPASVFGQLPKLLERAGPGAEEQGSITAIITVLVDGDDHNDPIADSVRGILDGHLVLDRSIADQGRYPPVDPLRSLSRLADKAWAADERALVLQLRKMISRFEDTSDLRMLGGWRPGSDPHLDKAVETVPAIYEALCQAADAPLSSNPFDDLVSYLKGNHDESSQESTDAQPSGEQSTQTQDSQPGV